MRSLSSVGKKYESKCKIQNVTNKIKIKMKCET